MEALWLVIVGQLLNGQVDVVVIQAPDEYTCYELLQRIKHPPDAKSVTAECMRTPTLKI